MSDEIAGDRLRAFIDRIMRLEEEKKAIAADIKEVFDEAKGTGFDSKVMRKIIAIMKEDEKNPDARKEADAILQLYKDALGIE